jgi:hypothetical protein
LSNLLASAVELTLASPTAPGSFEIAKGQLKVFDHLHEALGAARFESVTGAGVRLAQLGAPEGGGVSIQIHPVADFLGTPRVRGFKTRLSPLVLSEGARLRVTATGTWFGQPDRLRGTATIEAMAGHLRISADYSPIGANEVIAQVLAEGRLVGQSRLPGGVVATLRGTTGSMVPLTSCGKFPAVPFCYMLGFGQSGTFTLVDGREFSGDELRLLAANPTGPQAGAAGAQPADGPDGLSTFNLFCEGLSKMTLLSETILPATLSIVWQNGSAVISWTGVGTLEESPSPTGPWRDVSPAPAANRHSQPASGTSRYFRLRQ